MTIQDQVYRQIQDRLKRICAAEYSTAKKNKRGYLKNPITYPLEVDQLIELSSSVLTASEREANEIWAKITSGAIQDKFLKSTCDNS